MIDKGSTPTPVHNVTFPKEYPKKKYSVHAAVAAFFALTLFFFGPVQIYFSNLDDFAYGFGSLLPFLAGLTIATLALIMLLLAILPASASARMLSLLLAAGTLLWIQGNILVWDYGPLDGHDIAWSQKIHLGLIDTPLWILLLGAALLHSRPVQRIARPLSLAMIAMQAFSFLALTLPNAQHIQPVHYGIDHSRQFTFSNRRNVIIVILDTFQSDVFQELLNENPDYKNTFSGFTYFRNALGGSPSTVTAIPLILTGRQYDNSLPMDRFLKDTYTSHSLPLRLKKEGYDCDLFPIIGIGVYLDKKLASNLKESNPAAASDAAFLLDLSLFRQVPHFIKIGIYNRQSWLLSGWLERRPPDPLRSARWKKKTPRSLPDREFVKTMEANACSDSPQSEFKYYHLRGLHPPLQMDADCKYRKMAFNRANYKNQASGLLRLQESFLGQLKRINVFENSLIFIVGDHGPGSWGLTEINLSSLGGTALANNENPALSRVMAGALPLILVKRLGDAGERPLRVSDAPVWLGDIPATVLAELGLKAEFPGRSFFDLGENENRERQYFYYEGHRLNRSKHTNPMQEYLVRGFSWFDRSWQAGSKVFSATD